MFSLVLLTPTPSPSPVESSLSPDTLLGAVVALITLSGVIGSFAYAGREAKRAEKAADRGEAAAALTIDTLARIADGIEELAARPVVGGTLLAVSAPRVRWSLTHFQGDKYMLENVGDATAHQVRLTSHESLMRPQGWPDVQDLPPDGNVTFMALRYGGTSDSTITVHWLDEAGGDEQVWKYPLPPRPPRR